MSLTAPHYTAILSSDWNECLAPCGPFDLFAFHFPHLHQPLQEIFRRYTRHRISLPQAADQVRKLLPAPLTPQQVDLYLDREFKTYLNVHALMQWCREQGILFMINTTGMIGYFQRVFKKGLLPAVPVLSAHPLLRFASGPGDPPIIYPMQKTTEKGQYTQRVMQRYAIPPDRLILMGDSGGDGPHFIWGSRLGARLIGCMTKPSLRNDCHKHGIRIDLEWGHSYAKGDAIDRSAEARVDFMKLVPVLQEWISP